MRKWALWAVMLFFSLNAVAQPIDSTYRGYNWYVDNVSFDYTYPVLDGFDVKYFNVGETQIPSGGVPEHTLINFTRYDSVLNATVDMGGSLSVFFNGSFSSEGVSSQYTEHLAQLQQLLADSTDLTTLEKLPVLTAPQVPQALIVSPERVRFKNGSGIRAILVGKFDASPIINSEVFYVFDGITDDGLYSVSLRLPLYTPEMPDTIDFNSEAYNYAINNFSEYLTNTKSLLAQTTFTPDISEWHKVSSTLEVLAPAQTFPANAVTFGNFSMDASSVASRVEMDYEAGYNDDMGMFGKTPNATHFTFAGYASNNFHHPRVTLYAVSDIPQGEYPFTLEVNQLQTLLAEKPALNPFTMSAVDYDPSVVLPHLPLYNAAQVFVFDPQYLTLQGAQAIGYYTYYSQAVMPISNGEIFYTVQGISDDGQTVFAISFPLNYAFLAESVDYATFDFNAFSENYFSYLATTISDAQTGESSPSRAQIDALIASIRFN